MRLRGESLRAPPIDSNPERAKSVKKKTRWVFFSFSPRRTADAPPRKGVIDTRSTEGESSRALRDRTPPAAPNTYGLSFFLKERLFFYPFLLKETHIFIDFFNIPSCILPYHISFSNRPRILCKMPVESPIQAAKIITFWAAIPHFTTFSLQHNEDVAYLTAHNEQLF